ncbi:probable carboxylesterase 9 [Euphorbia lathyris]|uniref:probable carboxylesterase 9 n=1 Tax=Euphorbia lathyris TaxID=212925 RepID=UPI0033134C68
MSSPGGADNTMPDFDPYEHLHIARNPDGTITRLLSPPLEEANPDAITGAASKDITINAEKQTWIRLFRPAKLPSNDNTVARLPIVFNFHGGGFIYFSASMRESHNLSVSLATEIPSIAVSVNYRLAPEHRLPAQYEDAIDAILWVKQQFIDKNGEQWLKEYGDFSRCYISGRGCGGNIAFHACIRSLDLDLTPLKISGLVMNQPMFGGLARNKTELQHLEDPILPLSATDLIWELALPEGADRDHPFSNPLSEGFHSKKVPLLGKCLVFGFCGDVMVERVQDFVTLLVMAGVKVQACLNDDGFHNIDIVDKRWSRVFVDAVRAFINS